MAFARNRAGQMVAASDLPSVGPAIFHCAGCGGEVTRASRRKGPSARDFTMSTVLGWLYMRYRIVPALEDAEMVAVHQYLWVLTTQGYLSELPDQQFRVLPEPRPDVLSTLRRNRDSRLSVSGLRVCSERMRMEIPVNQV
ncbi:hypothetical protein [Paraburkholderia sp. CNPSo 3281]|uniref:hypothetical protein n=1 Tax=Paraburkholderia sp. CNPSo 3281 TaxID=2940933 RepID=UPI0020B66681|nr:hypothetical protein [Paraburkholderia sp. CNPSo 3281]MCP3716372.1 hypothetical protein [Paraburkholderia sp. CNPSo 3281]